MENRENLKKRKPTRLNCFDYSSTGAYFITLCTAERRQILSSIVGGEVLDAPKNVKLSIYGEIADKYINQLNDFYDNVMVDKYVIMPNHIHIMLFVLQDGASRTSPPTKQHSSVSQFVLQDGASRTSPPTKQHSSVSQFVSTFKRFSNKEYGINIWQRHFYDHIIRDQHDYEKHIKYIHENPLRWYYDELYTPE